MSNPYSDAIEAANKEIGELNVEKRRIEDRIRSLRQTLGALFRLTGDQFLDANPGKMGLTDAIRFTFAKLDEGVPATSSAMVTALRTFGFDFSGYKNPQASVNGTLMRLVRMKELKRVVRRNPDGDPIQAYILVQKPSAKLTKLEEEETD